MRKYLLMFALLAIVIISARAGDITDKGMYQGDLFTFLTNVVTMSNELKSDFNSSRGAQQAMVLSKSAIPGISSSTTSAAFATTTFSIGGVMYQKGSQTVALSAAIQSSDTSCLYLISYTSAGVATTTKGTEVADTANTGLVTLTLPAVPTDNCPVAYIKITASDSWTMGTNAYGIATTTFYDLSFVDGGSSVSATDLSLTGL